MDEILRKNEELKEFIRARVKEHQSTFDGVNVRDFLDLYIQTQQSTDTNSDSAIDGEQDMNNIL